MSTQLVMLLLFAAVAGFLLTIILFKVGKLRHVQGATPSAS
jgi:ABC-type multidrug transport system permease subunit